MLQGADHRENISGEGTPILTEARQRILLEGGAAFASVGTIYDTRLLSFHNRLEAA
jgi:hypothetical protein